MEERAERPVARGCSEAVVGNGSETIDFNFDSSEAELLRWAIREDLSKERASPQKRELLESALGKIERALSASGRDPTDTSPVVDALIGGGLNSKIAALIRKIDRTRK